MERLGMSAVMPPEHLDSYTALFDYIYKGDSEAVRVSRELIQLSHVWDDLIDKDNPVSDDAINAAFMAALCEIGGSWLWDQDAAALMRVCYIKWRGATSMETSETQVQPNNMAMAYSARAGFFDLFHHFVYKLHGLRWAEHVSETILRWHGEDFDDYCKEFWR
jgi:hypothetical protein